LTDIILGSLLDLLAFQHLIYLLIGVVLGLFIGVFPGLGGIAGLSMLIPFLYGLDQTSALAMLIGLVAVIPTSDTFASVLMGIPGSSSSQATVLDGFPLAKQGQAARALSAAFSASLIGGLIGAVVLSFFVVIAKPLILSFSSAELFMVSLLGLSMVGVMAGASLTKGLASCCLGLGIGSIGGAPATGEFRMDGGIVYLMDGLPLVVVALGLFAIPEILDLLRKKSSIAQGNSLGSGWLEGVKDTFKHWFLVLRCSALGSIIGAIPGLGGNVVDWIAYGHVVQTSKDKSKFSHGDIRGVLAPESANNAKEGGGMLPTLLFGIPGSGAMAVFLAGLLLIGLEPGPAMVGRDLGTTYTVIWSLALANVLGAGLCMVLAIPIAKLTTIRFATLAPFMIMVISFAAFQATKSLTDLLVLFAVGILGILMRRFGWSRPAFLIGFVLATTSETYLYQALQFYDWGFLTRTGVVIIGVIIVLSVWAGSRSKLTETPTQQAEIAQQSTDQHIRDRTGQIVFLALMTLGFLVCALDGFQQSFLGGVFTRGVGVVGLILCAFLAYDLMVRKQRNGAWFDLEHAAEYRELGQWSLWAGMLWVVALSVLTAIMGFVLAIVIFFLAFLRCIAGKSWISTLFMTACAIAAMLVLGKVLNLDFPGGLLQNHMELAWPFR
jgi:putative tricarboxylic transport membrane protein